MSALTVRMCFVSVWHAASYQHPGHPHKHSQVGCQPGCALLLRHRFTLPPQNFNWACEEVSDQQLLDSATAPDVKVAAGGCLETAGSYLQLATSEVP